MKTKLFIYLIFLFGITDGQNIRYAYDSKEMKSFLAGTLYVIPTGDKNFDDSLISSIKRYWKITPYQVITGQEVESFIKDDSKWFIAPVNSLDKFSEYRAIGSPVTTKIHEGGKDRYIVASLYIFHGSKRNQPRKMDFAIDMASCPLPFGSGEYGTTGLDYTVKTLNDIINVVNNNKLDPIKHAAGIDNPEVAEDMCSNPQILKDRTLLIPEDLTNYILPEKVLKKYKYKYKVVSLADMLSLLNSADAKDYCFKPDSDNSSAIYDPVTKTVISCGQSITELNDAIAGTGKKKKK